MLSKIPTGQVGIKPVGRRKARRNREKSMKISSKTHYGVQVCCLLGASDKVLSAKELERRTGVSSKYLEKVLRILLSVGAVKATRGAGGGYSLSRPASEIHMGKVVRALEEDNMEIIGCVNKTGCCCPSSALWKRLFEGINDILDGISLQQILEGNLENTAIGDIK